MLSSSDLSADMAQSLAMDVLGGFRSPGRVQVIADRSAAIRWAIDHTEVGSILLAGCGVKSWTDRDGIPGTDESIAQASVARKNSRVPIPVLSIFPPSAAAPYFSH
ncbi:MAG: hypothetical protein R3C56_04590 [Pirellulaceae bacterium]